MTLSWGDPRLRAIVWQALAVGTVLVLLTALILQTAANLKSRGIASGFDFLGREARFEIAAGWLSYVPSQSYARALAVGLVNTLRVAAIGIAVATVLGLVVGIARLSSIWVVAQVARYYIEILRNTPLLLQLLFWYSLLQALPGPRQALNPIPGVFLSLRGIFIPGLSWDDGFWWIIAAVAAAALVLVLARFFSQRRRDRTGQGLPIGKIGAMSALLFIGSAILAGRPALVIEFPGLRGFDFRGGASLSPEFAALLIGLSTYTSAFIGEIIRGGILAVDKGQGEAAAALGLSRGRILRLVILPQALRVIIPPTTSQYLNLTKNSSLAIAIGYPDLISVANTVLNQTGQAVEVLVIAMAFYLTASLAISFLMNLYNQAVALPGR